MRGVERGNVGIGERERKCKSRNEIHWMGIGD